jgi:hypothetical protein
MGKKKIPEVTTFATVSKKNDLAAAKRISRGWQIEPD